VKVTLTGIVENAVIVIGIASLWPWVFGYRGTWYLCASLVVLALLAIVAVRRFLRIKRAFDEMAVGQGGSSHNHTPRS
jgi:hypothetical protein